MANIDIVRVPYNGSSPAAADVIGGHVQMMFANIPAALPLIAAGQVRALAVTGKTRNGSLPDVPTMDEAGVPGADHPGRTFRPIVAGQSARVRQTAL